MLDTDPTGRHPPEPERRALIDAVQRCGLSLNSLSVGLGKNKSYLHQYLWRRSPRMLPEDVRLALAERLGIPAATLRPAAVAADGRITRQGPALLPARAASRDLPLHFVGTPHVQVPFRDLRSYVQRPERLLGIAGAIAGRLVDDGLAPAINIMDTLYCDPLDIVTKGTFAVVIHGELICVGLVTMITADMVELGFATDQRQRFGRSEITLLREVGIMRR